VLIKIINSTRAFDVRLIYATNGDKIGRLGTIEGALPTPDILVTQSRWDVFLPEEMSYGSPSTNMELAQDRSLVSRKEIQGELAGLEEAAVVQQAIRPLRISVPTAGVHYAFEKLYANQAGQDAWFRLPYASAGGAVLGQSISLAGTLLFWLGAGLFLVHAERARRLAALALATLGLAVLIGAVVVYHVSPTPALLVSVLVLVGAGAYYGRRWMPQWKVA
jgi:hypothetical protein